MTAVRSVAAVLAGLAAFVLSEFCLNYLLLLAPARLLGLSLMVFTLAYSVAFSILAGYITARLSPSGPMAHALALALLQLIGNIASAKQSGDTVPHWLLALLIVLPIPAVLFGAKLRRGNSGTDG